jgi:S-adenosyl-L-methionine hydrolase (adenosine-forming)
MEHQSIATLTSDFGSKDPYVGIMKGVMLKINPLLTIVDITHNIRPQNIAEAAFAVETGFSYFPHRSIHVVVVDPGVGSARRPILVSADYHYFIGPDNGIFSRIYQKSESLEVFHITAEHYFLNNRSKTFHGRDIFAPVAAWLSKGIHIERFGEPVTDYLTIPVRDPVLSASDRIDGEISYIDHFGNATTNIHARNIDDLLSDKKVGRIEVLVKGREVPFKDFYSEAEDNILCSLINSFGYLELFVNKGSAVSDFGLEIGDKVEVSPG